MQYAHKTLVAPSCPGYNEVGDYVINISYIEEFTLLAETLNFSKAAEKAFITQPALSRHIAAIENELGTKLFKRNTKHVELTLAGAEVYESFSEIVRLFAEAKTQLGKISQGKAGVLTISSPYYWTGDFTEPLVLSFHHINPECEVKIISCQPQEGMQAMIGGQSDIAVNLFSADLNNSIRQVVFSAERFAAVMDIRHHLANRDSICLAELSGDSFIFLENDGEDPSRYNTFILELLQRRSISPKRIYYTQQIDTLGMTIKQTGGVCVMPYGVRHMNRSYIKVVPLEDQDCVVPMCLLFKTDNENPLIPEFIKIVASQN